MDIVRPIPKKRNIFLILLDSLAIPASFAAVGVGLAVAWRAPNDGVALLAAIAVALVLSALLGPTPTDDALPQAIYTLRFGSFIWRLYGDKENGHD